MRKITRPERLHNHAGRLVAAAVLAFLGLVATGCGGNGQQERQANGGSPAPGAPTVGTRCAIISSDAGVREFYALADRVAGDERPDLAAMVAAADSPTWQLWRRSFAQQTWRAEPIGRAMHIALLGRDDLPERLQDKAYRLDLVRNFELALQRRAEITTAVERFVADERGCAVRDQLRGYLPEAALPDTLRMVFTVSLPEIRLFEGVFMIDGGLVWASGQDQLVRFLASTLYKQLTLVEGRQPNQTTGPDVLAQCLRLVRNEGVAAFIDSMHEISFDPRHTVLGQSSAKPDELCLQATRTLRSFDATLTEVRRIDEPTDEHWQNFFRLFVGAGSWQSTGWYMAQVIVDRFGLARLQTDGRSVPAFLAAYQEAARIRTDAPDAPRGSLARFLAEPPTFSDENAAWLDHELRQRFP